MSVDGLPTVAEVWVGCSRTVTYAWVPNYEDKKKQMQSKIDAWLDENMSVPKHDRHFDPRLLAFAVEHASLADSVPSIIDNFTHAKFAEGNFLACETMAHDQGRAPMSLAYELLEALCNPLAACHGQPVPMDVDDVDMDGLWIGLSKAGPGSLVFGIRLLGYPKHPLPEMVLPKLLKLAQKCERQHGVAKEALRRAQVLPTPPSWAILQGLLEGDGLDSAGDGPGALSSISSKTKAADDSGKLLLSPTPAAVKEDACSRSRSTHRSAASSVGHRLGRPTKPCDELSDRQLRRLYPLGQQEVKERQQQGGRSRCPWQGQTQKSPKSPWR